MLILNMLSAICTSFEQENYFFVHFGLRDGGGSGETGSEEAWNKGAIVVCASIMQ